MAKPAPDVCNKITALLELGETPIQVSERLGVDRQAVIDLNTKRRNKKKDADVKWAAKAPAELISDMVDKAKIDAPTAVVRKLERISDGLTGIQILDGKFHSTMLLALNRAEDLLNREDLTVGEWTSITNTISVAYKNIFTDSSVKVNVNNSTNTFSTDKLAMFKGSLRD